MVLDQGMWISRQINTRLPGRAALPHQARGEPGQRASFHGIATMSRIGFEEHEILDLMTFERNAQRIVFRCGDQPFFFVNTHLHYPPEARRERVEQLERLLVWLDRDHARSADGDPRRLQRVRGPGGRERPEEAVKLMKSRYRSAVRGRARAGAGEDVDDAGEHVRRFAARDARLHLRVAGVEGGGCGAGVRQAGAARPEDVSVGPPGVVREARAVAGPAMMERHPIDRHPLRSLHRHRRAQPARVVVGPQRRQPGLRHRRPGRDRDAARARRARAASRTSTARSPSPS